MTAKTYGYITKDIELDDVHQFILKYFDPQAKINRYENRFGESNEMAVYFTYKTEERRLFSMIYNTRKFSKTGDKHRMILMDLDFWGHSVEIMRAILSHFGGWIDENDCDTEEAYFMEPQKDGITPNIIKITRSELNRRMGGMVVIVDEDE